MKNESSLHRLSSLDGRSQNIEALRPYQLLVL